MSSVNQSSIDELLVNLLEKGTTCIIEGKQNGTLQPKKIRYFAWRIKNFQYLEDGPKYEHATGEHFDKEYWIESLDKIKNYLYSLDIYGVLKSKIEHQFSEYVLNELTHFLDMFLIKFCYDEIDQTVIIPSVKSFTDYLNGKPIECGAKVEFLGLTLEEESIDLHNGIVLQQTKKEDLEKEMPEYSRDDNRFDHTHPSLIMTVTTLGRSAVDVQHKIWDSEVILRLFTVGSIRHKSYTFFSTSFNSAFAGTGSTLDITTPAITQQLKKSEIQNLKEFWDEMKEKVTIFTRLGTHSSFVDIAYQRYLDGIMRKSGSIERSIADCMMGLEAIYLRDGGEQQELSYRLRLRVSRLSGLLGHDPFKMKNLIRDGYNVRSRFVHGSTLNHEDVEELEEKYESMEKFLFKLLDILRISIVISLMITVKKEKLIDLIDKSFLSEKFTKELIGQLFASKRILKIK